MEHCTDHVRDEFRVRINSGNDRLREMILLLATHAWVYDVQLTHYFIEKPWLHIPKEWLGPLMSLNEEELGQLPYGFMNEAWPTSLKLFIQCSVGHSVCKTIDPDGLNTEPIPIPREFQHGMSTKKQHEVTNMAAIVKKVCVQSGCRCVVDVGSGLGYLGQVLYRNYGMPVLGLEGDGGKSCGATRRSMHSATTCEGVTNIVFILKDTDESISRLEDLILTAIPAVADSSVCLVGLHSCGDLTPAMIKAYTRISVIKSLVVVGCCYHRMLTTEGTQCAVNFPLSHSWRGLMSDVDLRLGKFGLRLAAQETRARWKKQTQENHNFHTKCVAYRAILELYLSQKSIEHRKLRRKVARKSAFKNFHTYLDAVLARTYMELELTDVSTLREDLKKLFVEHESSFGSIEIFTALQVLLQPVLENVILLDRLTYIEEQGIPNSELRAIFDDETSPRNVAIISRKSIV